MMCSPIPGRLPLFLLNALAIILDGQQTPASLSRQPDHDLSRLSMLDRVVHGLLRDVIQMRCQRRRHESGRGSHTESGRTRQRDPATSAAHCCKADIRPCDSETTGQQTPGQFACLVDRFVHQLHNLGCISVVGQICSSLPAFASCTLRHEGDAGQVLAETIVQILADTTLFALR